MNPFPEGGGDFLSLSVTVPGAAGHDTIEWEGEWKRWIPVLCLSVALASTSPNGPSPPPPFSIRINLMMGTE